MTDYFFPFLFKKKYQMYLFTYVSHPCVHCSSHCSVRTLSCRHQFCEWAGLKRYSITESIKHDLQSTGDSQTREMSTSWNGIELYFQDTRIYRLVWIYCEMSSSWKGIELYFKELKYISKTHESNYKFESIALQTKRIWSSLTGFRRHANLSRGRS